MASRVIEVKPLIERSTVEAAKPLSKQEVNDYINETKTGAKAKEDPVDTLEALIKTADALKGTDEYKLKDKKDTDPADEFKDLTGGVEVNFGPKAKRAYQDVIASLSSNLDKAETKSTAQVYKQEKVLEDLFSLIRLKDEDNEYLKPVQREAGDLLGSAISSYFSANTTNPIAEYQDMLVGILDGNPVTSLRNTVDLIRSQGLDKLAKENSGFFGKLSRSYGQLGKALASHVYAKVHSLLQRPLSSFAKDGNVELLDGVKDQVTALKAEVFEKVFTEIKEKSGKQIDKIAREDEKVGTDKDTDFVSNFETKMLDLFQATDEEKASTSAHQVTEFLNTYAMRAPTAEAKVKRLETLEQSLKDAIRNAEKTQPKTITISADFIKGNADLETKFYEQILAESQELVSLGNKEPEISADEIIDILKKAGPTKKGDPSNQIALIKDSITAKFSHENITELINAVNADGSFSVGANAEFTDKKAELGNQKPLAVLEAIKNTLIAQIKKKRQDELTVAKKIVDEKDQPDAQAIGIATRKTWKLTVDKEAKATAESIQKLIKPKKDTLKADAKYYKKFMDDMAKHIIAPIMTKATTINSTAARLLMDSMIDSEGEFNSEFVNSFKPQAKAAVEQIEEAKLKAKNELETAKHTSSSAATKVVNSILENISDTLSYDSFITGLGLGTKESVVIKDFKKALNDNNTSKLGIKLDEDELKYLDTSTDSKVSAFDLTRRQLERVRIITSKLFALSEKKESFDKLGSTESSALTKLLADAKDIVDKLNKTKNASMTATYNQFKRDHLGKIDTLQKTFDVIDNIEVDENNIWDIDSEDDFEGTDAVNKILATLKDSVKVGLQTVMRFLGFKKTDSAAEFQKRIAAVPSDENHKGFIDKLRFAAMNMNSTLGEASTKTVA